MVVVVLVSPVLGLERGVQGVLLQVDLQGALGVQGGRGSSDGAEIHDGLYGEGGGMGGRGVGAAARWRRRRQCEKGG